jgi:hypothetical protein
MTSEQQEPVLESWQWRTALQPLDVKQATLAKGFLRSRPERWFPQISSEWLPLFHSLSAELRVTEVTPQRSIPEGLELGYGGSIDGEPFGMYFDREAIRMAIDVIVPGAYPESRDIVLEYIGRRIVATLKSTWVGSEKIDIVFDKRIDPFSVPLAGAVQITCSIHGHEAALWIGLGAATVERLDAMWKRQSQPVAKTTTQLPSGPVSVFFEVAQLAVPPADLVQYTQPETKIDLEVPVSDTIFIRTTERLLASAKMCQADGRLALEIASLNPAQPMLPDGMTRISVILGKMSVDSTVVQEYMSQGALWDTGIKLSDNVSMLLNGEQMARGKLHVYEGRFALNVIE